MIDFEKNPNWQELPLPGEGDTVQLKLVDIFDYLVKATVTEVKEKKISVNIRALYDHKTGVRLTGGKKLRLVGKEFRIERHQVQKIKLGPDSRQ